MQPLTLFESKRKYRKIIKSQESLTKDDIKLNAPSNPYRRIVGDIKEQLDASFLDFDMYQEAFVNDWPTFNQALLSVISRGANRVTILNLFMAENYEYELAIEEMGKIDYSQIGVTVSQTEFLAKNKDLQNLIADNIKKSISNEDISEVGVLLIADGQPPEWDSLYPLADEENTFRENIKKKVVKMGIKKDRIAFAWLENRDPTLEDGIECLRALGSKTIVLAATTTPVECLHTLYDIPVLAAKATKDQDVKLIHVNAWNTEENIVKLYLGLITKAKKLPLAELGKDADIVLQQIGVGAKLADSEKEKSEDLVEEEEEEITLKDLNEMVESVDSEDEEE
ncbi:MAG: hypothetical protein FK733_02545 [Asgard group archaeon]|nr:hypothetical protein [Asgard group archaeon]